MHEGRANDTVVHAERESRLYFPSRESPKSCCCNNAEINLLLWHEFGRRPPVRDHTRITPALPQQSGWHASQPLERSEADGPDSRDDGMGHRFGK